MVGLQADQSHARNLRERRELREWHRAAAVGFAGWVALPADPDLEAMVSDAGSPACDEFHFWGEIRHLGRKARRPPQPAGQAHGGGLIVECASIDTSRELDRGGKRAQQA